jgi:hypothetical protein
LNDGQRIDVSHVDPGIENFRDEGAAKSKRLPNSAGKQDHSGKH